MFRHLQQLLQKKTRLSQALPCNPTEVAYGSHCLSHRCLSSFANTLTEPYTQRYMKHTRDVCLTDALISCFRFLESHWETAVYHHVASENFKDGANKEGINQKSFTAVPLKLRECSSYRSTEQQSSSLPYLVCPLYLDSSCSVCNIKAKA